MPSFSRSARVLLAIAVTSFGVIVLAYLLAPTDRWTRAYLADLSWTWSSAYGLVGAAIAARRHPDPEQRRAWAWIGAGCLLSLAGQLVWNEAELVRHVPAPYPSIADVGFLGVYVCFMVAVVKLGRAQPRRLDLEVLLDAMLVTLTVGALTYTFLLTPLLAVGGRRAALITSLAWSVGAVAVLWLILVELVRSTTIPLATTGGVIASVSVLCVSNVMYARMALRGTFHDGSALDLGWDAGFLLLAATAAVALNRSAAPVDRLATISGHAARVTAVVIGLVGIAAVGVAQALTPVAEPAGAVLICSGLAIVGARIVYSLHADRRYTALLETEVANQTRTLMEALGATAAAERNLRLVMDAVPDAIVLADAAGRIVESNEPARALGAVPGADSQTVFAGVTPEAAGLVRERLAAAFRGEAQRLELPLRRADGSQGLGALLCAPVREGGRITRMLVLVRDITEQKRSESQYQQAEKLAAMGHLVSGVAHEINNPAAIISGFAQTLLLDELKPEHREMLKMMSDEATRIGRITANLLAFARAGGTQRALVDVNDVVRRTFALRSYHLTTLTITVSLDLDPGEPKIWANGSELQQLVLNLLINAEQALVTVEPPRTITVRTRADEREARLEIADSGPGIAPEIRAKVFDPFFTTKGEGVGTGLGLSICYGIAREHGGRIWVESEPGSGARFCVVLPRDQRAEARPLPPIAPPASASGRLAVLVVDDEVALRNALLRFLNRRGIQGEGVADGAEALHVLRQRDFDVIISDVRMPGMSGREFLERLRRERADLVGRVVFATGDSFAPDAVALLQESGLPTITKPLDFAALEHVIREVAGRAAGRVA